MSPTAIEIQQETRTFSVKEIFDAIEQNGFQHLRQEWFSTNSQGKTVGACVLGQAGLNLGVAVNPEMDEDPIDGGNTLYEQLNRFPTPKKWLDPINPAATEKAGDAIIYWNDKPVTDEYGNKIKDSRGAVKWYLRTYGAVVKMAREVLEPSFDKTIELVHYEY